MIVRNLTRDLVVGTGVRMADSFGTRLLGLMFRKGLGQGEGLMIRPCQAVHTHFMRFPIDVIFLDGEGQVLHVVQAMQPWRHSPVVKGSHAVLELAAWAAGPTAPGDRLELTG